MQTNANLSDKPHIATLNSFLRGEIAAVETYALATAHLHGAPGGALHENLDCHQRRAELLRNKILEANGTPDETSGAWGSFAKLVEQGAAVIGQRAVYATLEEGEDHGLAVYRDHRGSDEVIAKIVRDQLLPAQVRTHERIRALREAAAV